MFLKVDTDEGISGRGEPVIEGLAATVEAAVHEFSRDLIGKGPTRIDDLWQTVYRSDFYRGGPILMSATASIDRALWYIKDKALGVPVYELLGGKVRDRMKVCSRVGGDRPGGIVGHMRRSMEGGFDTFKLNDTEEMAMLDTPRAVGVAVKQIALVHEALGTSIGFGIDFHGRVSATMARVSLRELEPYRPSFVEQPVLAEQAEPYPRLAAGTCIPLATGERMYSRFEFKRVLEAGGIAILQPGLPHAGGITGCHGIAALAETCDVALAPRCPLGPVALASCLQVDFVAYDSALQEQSMGIAYNRGMGLLDHVIDKEDFHIESGFIAAPPKPGLGVETDEERVIAAIKAAPDWRNPVRRHADGSVAEW